MLKILLISHPEQDYLEALVVAGLLELPDVEVSLFPPKMLYVGQTISTFDPITSWCIKTSPEDHYLKSFSGSIHPAPWWSPPKLPKLIDSWDKLDLREFDAVVFTPRFCGVKLMWEIVSKYGRDKIKKLVLLDGEDYFDVRWDLAAAFSPDLYLKLSHVPSFSGVFERPGISCAIKPFSYCTIPPRLLPKISSTRERCLYVRMGITHPLRKLVLDSLQGMGIPLAGNTPPENESLSWSAASGLSGFMSYMTDLGRYSASLVLRGHGHNPMRMFEASAMGSAMLLDAPIPVTINPPWVDGENCFYTDPTRLDIISQIRAIFDRNDLIDVGLRGREFVLNNHTCIHRAKQLLEMTLC